MIKIHQMRAFNELMVAKSMSEAARNLHRTQPSISATIASLEADLGLSLFQRKNGRLLPVPEAEYLHKECEEILQRLEMLGQNIQRIKAIDRGEISLACMPGPSVFFLPHIIAEQVKDRPNLRSTVVSRSSDAVYQLIAAQQHDIGIADYDPARSDETSLLSTSVFSFDCLCAVPASDRLARVGTVKPKDLAGRPMATLYTEHTTFVETSKVFLKADSELNVRFQAQYFLPVLTYVERGLACAIVDPIAAYSYQLSHPGKSKIAFKPFAPAVKFEIALLRPAHRPASVIAQHFGECLTTEFERISLMY